MALRTLAEVPRVGGHRPGSPPTPSAPRPPRPPAASSDASPFARLLGKLGQEVDAGERTMKTALSGRDLGAQELLALQVGVYRYSEAIDLASKLVDRATSGIKTVLSGQ